jgi:signal transduction histidine kinase
VGHHWPVDPEDVLAVASPPAAAGSSSDDEGPTAPFPPSAPLASRLAVVGLLLAGAVVVARGRYQPGLWWVPVSAAALLAVASAWARLRSSARAVQWAVELGCVVGGAALGSVGHPEIAVAVAIPVAWLGAAEGATRDGAAPPLLAAAAGFISAALADRATVGPTLAAVTVLGVAAWAVWAGRLIGAEVSAGNVERAELRRLRTEMVTTVSHELRTPLTVIQGVTATLSRRWDVLTEPQRLDLIDVLIENVSSLDASILHFADAARLERGQIVISPEWVDISAAVDAAVARRSATLAGHDIGKDLVVAWVWADRTSLERMLEHLLMNAARFSSMGLPIVVRTRPGRDDVTVSVTDRGQGIAPHLLARIWEPLQRGDVSETGISRGAGLGLTIVRELARLHGGDANLQSIRGRGTTVSVTLPQPGGMPVTPPATPEATPPTTPPAGPPPSPPPPAPQPAASEPGWRGALSHRPG